MTNKKYLGLGILLVLSVLLTSSVYALAVSSPYWPENPLRISSGESIDLQLVLKNSAGSDSLVVTGVVVEGAEVASITDSSATYNVPALGEAIVNVRVSVPSDSPIGGSYPVKLSFKTATGSQGGSVAIGSEIDASLPVFVVQESESVLYKAPEKTSSGYLWAAVVAVLVLAAVVVILSKKKKK